MKRVLLLFFILHFSLFTLLAVPALRESIQYVLPDGTTTTIYLHGDEHFHYTTLSNGDWVRERADGFLERVHPLSKEQINTRRAQSIYRKASTSAYPLNITERGLVILVNFKDKAFQPENTLESMQEMLNGDNYTFNGATGSVRKYFQDQSSGQYNPNFDVVGPITVSQSVDYYGQNDEIGNDAHVDSLIMEACRIAVKQYGVNFANYDNNNDGEVDFIYFIYAGNGENDGGGENTIWPHTYQLYGGYKKDLVLNNKRINTYACGAEINTKGHSRCGIGVFCHEFSHVLGLPDFYSTDSETTHQTLGEWDILDYGSYNNSGHTPPAYSAYERLFLGWLTPTLVPAEKSSISLSELQESNSAAIITATGTFNNQGNDPDPNCFYLLENRQQTSWDTYLPNHGLLLTKVNYSYAKWFNNTVNNDPDNLGVAITEPNAITHCQLAFDSTTIYSLQNITETDNLITLDISFQNFFPDILFLYDIEGRLIYSYEGKPERIIQAADLYLLEQLLAPGVYVAKDKKNMKYKLLRTATDVIIMRKRSKVKH